MIIIKLFSTFIFFKIRVKISHFGWNDDTLNMICAKFPRKLSTHKNYHYFNFIFSIFRINEEDDNSYKVVNWLKTFQ